MFSSLKDIATVSSGVSFRSRIESSAHGSMRVVQMKDLSGDSVIHLNRAIRIHHMKVGMNQFAQFGDIVFCSRRRTYTAAIIGESVKDVIVAAPLFLVRPDRKKVLPEYLLWWMSQPDTRNYFASQSETKSVQMIKKQTLEQLEVKLPDLGKQYKISEIFKLSLKEQNFLEEIKRYKGLYIQKLLMQIAKIN